MEGAAPDTPITTARAPVTFLIFDAFSGDGVARTPRTWRTSSTPPARCG